MEIGALFLLVLVAIVVVVGGGAVLAIAAHGRKKQLSSDGGTLDARPPDEDVDPERPEHLEVDTEQRTRFVGSK
jgi:hypothetical protein